MVAQIHAMWRRGAVAAGEPFAPYTPPVKARTRSLRTRNPRSLAARRPPWHFSNLRPVDTFLSDNNHDTPGDVAASFLLSAPHCSS